MANELSLTITGNFSKNGATQIVSSGTKNVTVTGNYSIRNTQAVGTVDETLQMGEMATAGYAFVHNLSTANYCDFGNDGSNYPMRLKAGEWMATRLTSAVFHAKANTAACDIEYCVIEN